MADDLNLKIVIKGEDQTSGAFGKTRAGLQSINDQLNSLKTALSGFLAIKVSEIIGNQISKVIDVADGYKTMQSRIKIASDSTNEFVTAQTELFNVAQRTRTELSATTDAYIKVDRAVKQLGGTQQQSIGITETLNQAIQLTSQGAAQDSAALLQFSQALGSGVLAGDELKSILENSTGLAQALADGLGVPVTALKTLGEQGQITGDKLINALINVAPEVAKKFAELPLTVGGALTLVSNKFTQYIGEADAANGATAKLANTIKFAADNFKPLAETALTIATIYGITLLQGLVKSGAAMVNSAIAAREYAASQAAAKVTALELLQTEVTLANTRVKAIAPMIEMAQLHLSLIAGTEKEAAAKRALTASILEYKTAVDLANSKQAALAASVEKAPSLWEKMGGGIGVVNGALSVFIAWDIGQTIGGWLNKFELVRLAGTYIAESFVIAGAAISGLVDRASFSDIAAQISKIQADFNEVRANTTDKATDAQARNNTAAKASVELLKVQSVQAEKLAKQYQSLADAEAEIGKQKIAQLDDTKTQTIRTVETRVSDNGGVDRSRQREREITQVLVQAAQERQKITEQTTKKQLDLLDKAHGQEIAAAQKIKKDTGDIDTKWLQSKQKVLADWQSGTRKTIDELIALEQKHRNAAIQIDNEIANNKRSTQELVDDLTGKNDVNNSDDLSNQRSKAEKLKDDIRSSQKKGDLDGELAAAKRVQDAYANLLKQAKNLFSQDIIDQSELDRAGADLIKVSAEVDKVNAKKAEAEKKTTGEITAEVEKQKDGLANANALAKDLLEKLQTGIKIIVDASAVDTAIEQINALETTKTVTVAVNYVTNGAPPASDAATTTTVPGFADGVRLPGFGGGDRHPALLESGEGVVNKFGMQKLDEAFGPGFFDGINAGNSPVELLRKHAKTLKLAEGGRIAFNMPSLDMAKLNNGNNSGTPINIHLPDGNKFGPFMGSGDSSAALAAALGREVMIRGRRS